ncbi:hypothetical protein ACQZET_11370 [Corynebacterium diphtheriae]|uniref:hypothetical protein n=1 Tax=Corynebacterium diphtheriae TaxID=1717 RepID=UPI0040427322
MFKRSLVHVAAVAVVSGAVVAPANAMTLTVNNDDMTCTINLTVKEATVLGLTHPETKIPKERIPTLKAYANGLPAVHKEKADLEKELANSKLDSATKEKLKSRLEGIKQRITILENFNKALDACNAGNGYNSDRPSDSDKPDVERAQPSTDGKLNGAGIGAIVAGSIVAILGILAAALPFIKPMLPVQLRALLP